MFHMECVIYAIRLALVVVPQINNYTCIVTIGGKFLIFVSLVDFVFVFIFDFCSPLGLRSISLIHSFPPILGAIWLAILYNHGLH